VRVTGTVPSTTLLAPLLRDAQPRSEAHARRLLLISPGFPPAAAVGGLRWQKMLRVLESHGWQADVLTVVPADPRESDPARLEDLPPSTRVYGLPAAALEDRTLRRVLRLVQALRPARRPPAHMAGAPKPMAAPTPSPTAGMTASLPAPSRSATYRQALRLAIYRRGQRAAARAMADACRALSVGGYDVVVSSGPPHSAHLAARVVAKRMQAPWLMDWRDPWTFDEFLEQFDAVAYARAERAEEARCVRAAALTVVNTPPVARRLAELYPDAASRIVTIPNGADVEPLPPWTRSERFRIVYAGSLFQGRDPRIFMRAVRLLCDRHGVPADRLVLQFVTGQTHYDGQSLQDWAQALDVAGLVEFHAYMSRRRLLEWLAGTAVNTLVQIPSTYQVPAKLFEYVQLPAWLVAVTNAPNAISEMLAGSTGIVLPPDPERIADELASLYRRWAEGEQPQPVNDGRFDRAKRAEEMLAALERIAVT